MRDSSRGGGQIKTAIHSWTETATPVLELHTMPISPHSAADAPATETPWPNGDATSRLDIELVNLTGHAVVLIGVHRHLSIPASGQIAAIHHRTVTITGYVNGVPLLIEQQPEVVGLPAFRRGTAFIVSRMVLDAVAARSDLLCPGHLVRDSAGTVIAAGTLVTRSPTLGQPRVEDRSTFVPDRCRPAPAPTSSVWPPRTTPRTA